MLKPRFKNMADMISEFKESLEYMDKDMPKDASLLKKRPAAKSVMVTESVVTETRPVPKAEAAPLSKYSSRSAALESFRVLAGLTEREMSPWNPGILGETRTVKKLQEDFGMTVDVKVKK